LVIDSITFDPEERVFTIEEENGLPFPVTVYPGTTGATFRIQFRPRYAREYEAKIVIHTTKPCPDIDSTFSVFGEGTSGAYYMPFAFNPDLQTIDTLRMNTCDIIEVPIYAREVSVTVASALNIDMVLDYDTTKAELIDVQSTYVTPTLSTAATGSRIVLVNASAITDTVPIARAFFAPKGNRRDTFSVRISDVEFDTEQVVIYRLLAAFDAAQTLVIVNKPEVELLGTIDFGLVNILDCTRQTIQVQNTGDVAITLQELLSLPPEVQITNVNPPLLSTMNIGEVATVELEFCPTSQDIISSSFAVVSQVPCPEVSSTSTLQGQGFAPTFPYRFAILPPFDRIDTVTTTIGDTVTMTVWLDTNVSLTYRGQEFWLEDFDFSVDVITSQRALQYLSAESLLDGGFSASFDRGIVTMEFEGIDSLQAGEIARITYIAAVPDSIASPIAVSATTFSDATLMFLDPEPQSTQDILTHDGKCTITNLAFTDVIITDGNTIKTTPNPATDNVTITVKFQETVPVFLELYSSDGRKVRTFLDGSQRLKGGEYAINFDVDDLPSGQYFTIFKAGILHEVRPLNIVR
jgi:hypothetical protein